MMNMNILSVVRPSSIYQKLFVFAVEKERGNISYNEKSLYVDHSKKVREIISNNENLYIWYGLRCQILILSDK